MEPGIIPEGMDDHNHARDAVIEARHGSKEDHKALPGAVAEFCKQLAVVFEIDGNTEYKLSLRDGIENVVGAAFSEPNRLFRMTTRANPASFSRNCQKVFMLAFGVGAAHPGESPSTGSGHASCKSPHHKYSSTTSSTTGGMIGETTLTMLHVLLFFYIFDRLAERSKENK